MPEQATIETKPVFLSKKEVLERIPVTGPTLWNWVRTGKFPQPRLLATNKTVWLEHEVIAWMEARPVLHYGTKSTKSTKKVKEA